MARLRISYKTDELEHLIEARIRQGQYEVDSRLPTERELSEELSVARGTIRKAYRALHHKGVVSYVKRSYTVKDIQEPYEFKEKEADAFGLFFSKKRTQDSLLETLENTLRKKGVIPISINLDALDPLQKDFSILNYIHTRLKGAFFCSETIGKNNISLDENLLGNIPFPYLFVGPSPNFINKQFIKLNENIMIEKCSEILEKNIVKNVHIIWPWPMNKTESKWLHLLSQCLESSNIESSLSSIKNIDKLNNKKEELVICTGSVFDHLEKNKNEFLVLGNCEKEVNLGIQIPKNELVNSSINLMLNELSNEGVKSISKLELNPQIITK
jgi:DNA-binding transcriptional regulator YhcF (GntR family)